MLSFGEFNKGREEAGKFAVNGMEATASPFRDGLMGSGLGRVGAEV